MPDFPQQDRPVLSAINTAKIAKIAHELDMSKSEVLNRIIDSVTTVELYQIVKFGIKTDEGQISKPRRIITKRQNFATKF